jgi:hypothetical protein
MNNLLINNNSTPIFSLRIRFGHSFRTLCHILNSESVASTDLIFIANSEGLRISLINSEQTAIHNVRFDTHYFTSPNGQPGDLQYLYNGTNVSTYEEIGCSLKELYNVVKKTKKADSLELHANNNGKLIIDKIEGKDQLRSHFSISSYHRSFNPFDISIQYFVDEKQQLFPLIQTRVRSLFQIFDNIKNAEHIKMISREQKIYLCGYNAVNEQIYSSDNIKNPDYSLNRDFLFELSHKVINHLNKIKDLCSLDDTIFIYLGENTPLRLEARGLCGCYYSCFIKPVKTI